MMTDLYNQILRRRSFHVFKEKSGISLTDDELSEIYSFFNSLKPLFPIQTAIRIVPVCDGYCRQDYEILFFSEKKDGYLQNVGYLGEQLDLFLVSKNIGTLWFGLAKSDEQYQGLDYVIRIAIAKVDSNSFRSDLSKVKRKPLSSIWQGKDLNIANVVRYVPSACNSQPFWVECKDRELSVFRKSSFSILLPRKSAVYFNQIDIGIFICTVELCLCREKIGFDRELFVDSGAYDEPVLNARYVLCPIK